eukprot:2046910-Lingulodinium_polyedra.AAC.1
MSPNARRTVGKLTKNCGTNSLTSRDKSAPPWATAEPAWDAQLQRSQWHATLPGTYNATPRALG